MANLISAQKNIVLLLSLYLVSGTAIAEHLRIGGSGTDIATFSLIAEAFKTHHSKLDVTIPASLGSSGGIKALVAGHLDVAIVSREPKPTEMNHGLQAYQYARTPLVFAVAITNSTAEITTTMLNEIYSGTHPNWPNGEVARPVLRQNSDSDTISLITHLPKFSESLQKAYQRRGIPIALTDQEATQLISNIPGAIGTSTLAVILAEKRPLKALKLNGVEPSIDNISTGKYSLAKELYVVLPAQPTKSAVLFVKFIMSATAQEILKESGHQTIMFDLKQ